MFARYLQAYGADVTFSILDNGHRRRDWESLSLDEQAGLVQDQVELASILLETDIRVLTEAPSVNGYTVFGNHVLTRISMYDRVPLLLNELVAASRDPLPAGFLLPLGWGEGFESLDFQKVPYVAWSVRRGIWDPARDNTTDQVIADFRDIRKLFPCHRVVLLSTPDTLEWVFKVLTESGDLSSGTSEAQILFPQPTPGFINAMHWLLPADMYFQRDGGGIGVVAIFSEVPYLMLVHQESGYIEQQLNGEKIVAWASPHQRFLQRPLGAHLGLFCDLYGSGRTPFLGPTRYRN